MPTAVPRGDAQTLAEPAVSVIVPVHNGGPAFLRCLESLQALDPPPLEILAVDDGGNDSSDTHAERLGFQLLRTPRQSGPATARNLGARAARGDLLFFVDADVTVAPDAIRRIRQACQDYPDAAALLGSYDDEPAAPGFWSQYKNLAHHYVHQHSSEDGCTFWGACGVIRRDVFHSLGGFDESYRRPSIEDIELGYRLKAAGQRIRLCKDLRVKHLKRWTAGSLLHTDFFCRALPWTELILRSGRFENDLNISRTARAKVALVGLLVLGLFWWPAVIVIAMALLVLDAPLLWFLCRKRGPWFTLRTVPWQWFSYGFSGLAFVIGVAKHLRRGGGW